MKCCESDFATTKRKQLTELGKNKCEKTMNHDKQLFVIKLSQPTQTNVKKELFPGRTVLFGRKQYVTAAGTDCWKKNNSPMQFRVLGQKKCQPHPKELQTQ